MPITRNEAKRKMQQGQMALGFQVYHLRSIATPLLAAASGHDFLFIDMEHGAFSMQEATQICIAALPTGVAPIVRVCSGALDEGTRLLDNGAMGIVVPHVDTAQQAQRIADAFHYPPAGTRSWGGPPALYGYQVSDVALAQNEINDEIMTVVMIESPEAVRNSDAIAAVAGIDVFAVRQLRSDNGTRHSRSNGTSEADRRLPDRRRRLPETWKNTGYGRHQRK